MTPQYEFIFFSGQNILISTLSLQIMTFSVQSKCQDTRSEYKKQWSQKELRPHLNCYTSTISRNGKQLSQDHFRPCLVLFLGPGKNRTVALKCDFSEALSPIVLSRRRAEKQVLLLQFLVIYYLYHDLGSYLLC